MKENRVNSYQKFLEQKKIYAVSTGIENPPALNSKLFEFQRDCVSWGLKRGRAAFFEDCGLGKTIQELELATVVAAHTQGEIIIVAPLGVSYQHEQQAKLFGYEVFMCDGNAHVRPGVNITNYEKLHRFDLARFAGVILDESSILKNYDGKTRNQIVEGFSRTRFRFAGTATPAPNDYMELGNHAEFLGVMTRSEMLATFFVHDGGDTSKWRIKGHAQDKFWQWVCTWAVNLRKPSDLGYDDGGFQLPQLTVKEISVDSKQKLDGYLFPMPASSLMERRQARKSSINERVRFCYELINGNENPKSLSKILSEKQSEDEASCAGNNLPQEQWLVWCALNSEQEKLEKIFGRQAVSIKGSTKEDDRAHYLKSWLDGKVQVMISKPEIFGYGLNLQNCHNMAFVGMSDSWEMYYQCVRRCWRFGQLLPVNVWIIVSKLEGAVVANIKRKERDAMLMAGEMVKHMAEISQKEIKGMVRETEEYKPKQKLKLPAFINV